MYEKLGQHAIDMAEALKVILEKKGYEFYLKSPTNQQFVIVENSQLERLDHAGIVYGFWEKYDTDHTVIRFATSWSTTRKDLEALEQRL